jgi:5-methylcytosine-specific restriction endonuclease McrA
VTAASGRGRPWRVLRAQVLAEEEFCQLCGAWVDKSLPRGRKWSAQVDHIVPVSVAPQMLMVRSNLRLVHQFCNQSRGAGKSPKRQPVQRRPQPPVFGPLSTSRPW